MWQHFEACPNEMLEEKALVVIDLIHCSAGENLKEEAQIENCVNKDSVGELVMLGELVASEKKKS